MGCNPAEWLLRRWLRRRLGVAVECVLLNHAHEIGDDGADPSLAELAFEYDALTGWSALRELERDAP